MAVSQSRRILDLVQGGRSPTEAGQWLGVAPATVYAALQDLTIDGVSQEQRLLNLVVAGHSQADVALWMNVSTATVGAALQDLSGADNDTLDSVVTDSSSPAAKLNSAGASGSQALLYDAPSGTWKPANTAQLGNVTPAALGTASPGSATTAMRSDAVFPFPPCANPVILGAPGSGNLTWPCGGSGTFAEANGTCFAFPVIFDKSQSIGLGVQVNSAGSAGSVYRFGVYADGSGGYPGSVISDFGTVATTSTGRITLGAWTPSVGVRYWICCVAQGAPTTTPTVVLAQTFGVGVPAPNAVTASPLTAAVMNGITGALPATFTVSTASGGTAMCVVAN